MSRVCSKCGASNESEMRVCVHCAASLGNFCAACGFENPAGFKFCGQCGANLQQAAAPTPGLSPLPVRPRPVLPTELAAKVQAARGGAGERREVTVLFADLHGFTGLSERLDPEEVYTLINRCLQRFVEIIYTYEGSLDKFTGDGLMALFGAPVAVENHAERACRAALEMQAVLDTISRELEPSLGRKFQLRIGLNSGAVIAGTVGSDLRMDYTVIGDTVNVASRLESLAEPGSVLVSQTVFEQAKPFCDFAPLGTVTVKGRREPVQAHQLLALKAQPGETRGIPGLRAPLIGRAQELAALEEVARCLAGKQGRIVLIQGEAGLGKSRLTAEFRSILDANVQVAEGACHSYRQSVSLWPYISILRQLLGLSEHEKHSATDWEELVERLELLTLDTEEIAPFLALLLGIPLTTAKAQDRVRYLAPAQLRQQLFLAVRQTIIALSWQAPLLLIFEDLHWADPSTIDLLLFLAEVVPHEALGLYCITRAFEGEAVERLAQRFQQRYTDITTSISLTPLDAQHSTSLLEALLAIPDLPPDLISQLPANAEGNPFFLEELVRSLIDRNIIFRDGDQWRLTPGVEVKRLDVPSSLSALLLTRVDRLAPEARQLLQLAAVIGRSFTLPLLQRVAVLENCDLAFYAALQRLEAAALVRRWQSPTGEGVEHVFRHALVRDIVYNSLLTDHRARLHRRVAEAVEGIYSENLDNYIEVIAHHYLEGQSYDRAFPYLIRAGKRAAERFDNEQALRFFRSAEGLTSLIRIPWEQRAMLSESIADLLVFTGDTEHAMVLYQNALSEVLKNGGRPQASAELHRKVGRVLERRSEYDEAERWLGLALAELELEGSAGSTVERARIYNDLGWIAFRKGDFDRGQNWALKSLEFVEGTEHLQEIASAYNRLTVIFHSRGSWEQALSFGRRTLALRQKMGFTQGLPSTYNNLAGLALISGAWNETADYLAKAYEISRKIGYSEGQLLSLLNLAILANMRGDIEGMAEYIEQGRALVSELKNPIHSLSWYQECANLAGLRREWVAMKDGALEALTIAQQIGVKEWEAGIQCVLADAFVGNGESEQSFTAAHRAIVLATDINSPSALGAARRALGKCYYSVGKWDDAIEQLQKSEHHFLDYHDRYEVARTRYHLARAWMALGASRQAETLLAQASETFAALGAAHDLRLARAERERWGGAAPSNGHGPVSHDPASPQQSEAVE